MGGFFGVSRDGRGGKARKEAKQCETRSTKMKEKKGMGEGKSWRQGG